MEENAEWKTVKNACHLGNVKINAFQGKLANINSALFCSIIISSTIFSTFKVNHPKISINI